MLELASTAPWERGLGIALTIVACLVVGLFLDWIIAAISWALSTACRGGARLLKRVLR